MKLRNESAANDEQLDMVAAASSGASLWFHKGGSPVALRSMGGLDSFAPLKVSRVVEGVPSERISSQRSGKYRQFL